MSMAEFFNMGGYAFYVWSCYGIAALVVAGLVWQSLRDWRVQSSLAEELERAAGGRARRAADTGQRGEKT
jgi:heme exporter protein D